MSPKWGIRFDSAFRTPNSAFGSAGLHKSRGSLGGFDDPLNFPELRRLRGAEEFEQEHFCARDFSTMLRHPFQRNPLVFR